jgi:polar amino acid transport system substrate-binding protein
LVGALPIEIDRRALYDKELELRMSMSYGPGRYDRRYEEVGLDYPLAYVRWTENRNLGAFLALAASGRIDPRRLDVEIAPFAEAERVYAELARGERRSLATVFRYETGGEAARTLELRPAPPAAHGERGPTRGELGVAFLGAGNYAKGVLLPAVSRCRRVRRAALVTATGPSARRTAEKFGYARCGTDPAAVLDADDVDLVFVATRHDSHAALAAAALRAGRAVWLEKPAALDEEQLAELLAAQRESAGFLAIGYNRRFSPHARAVREAFVGRHGPLALQYTVAAGPTPGGTWHTDPAVGGGRVIGEVCHFVDLCNWLVGAAPLSAYARVLGRDAESDDSTVALLAYPDGSSATIAYLANTSRDLPKERWEASADGRSALCENFRATRLPGGRPLKTLNQDKGQAAAVAAVIDAVRRGEPSPFAPAEIAAVSRTTFAILASTRSGQPEPVA